MENRDVAVSLAERLTSIVEQNVAASHKLMDLLGPVGEGNLRETGHFAVPVPDMVPPQREIEKAPAEEADVVQETARRMIRKPNKKLPKNKQYFNLHEAAAYIGISYSGMRRRMERGKIKTVTKLAPDGQEYSFVTREDLIASPPAQNTGHRVKAARTLGLEVAGRSKGKLDDESEAKLLGEMAKKVGTLNKAVDKLEGIERRAEDS